MIDAALLLVGCGKMGGALLAGWLDQGLAPDRVRIVEPAADAGRAAIPERVAGVVASPDDLDDEFVPDVVLLAVKPQMMAAAAPHYRAYVRPGTQFLSIAAGQTLAVLAGHLGAEAAIVRTMPNTPAAVGRGITVACANAHVSQSQKQLAETLMAAVGEVGWVDDEALLDAVTGVSGSGPAYVFLLVECLAAAGEEMGLDRALAMRLARATIYGAGELVRQSDEEAATLRQNVTSPKGTTEAALKVLMADDGMKPLIARAVRAATDRSRELAGG